MRPLQRDRPGGYLPDGGLAAGPKHLLTRLGADFSAQFLAGPPPLILRRRLAVLCVSRPGLYSFACDHPRWLGLEKRAGSEAPNAYLTFNGFSRIRLSAIFLVNACFVGVFVCTARAHTSP